MKSCATKSGSSLSAYLLNFIIDEFGHNPFEMKADWVLSLGLTATELMDAIEDLQSRGELVRTENGEGVVKFQAACQATSATPSNDTLVELVYA